MLLNLELLFSSRILLNSERKYLCFFPRFSVLKFEYLIQGWLVWVFLLCFVVWGRGIVTLSRVCLICVPVVLGNEIDQNSFFFFPSDSQLEKVPLGYSFREEGESIIRLFYSQKYFILLYLEKWNSPCLICDIFNNSFFACQKFIFVIFKPVNYN